MLPSGIVRATYRVTIYMNGGNLSVTLASGTELTSTNVLDSLNFSAKLSGTNQNPVGVLSANTLSLNITSKDLSLDPTNQSSPYYGYMNTSAWAVVSIIDDQSNETKLGTFYVDTWQPNITDSTPFSIQIEFVDLISVICKMPVPFVEVTFNMTLLDYVIAVLNELNKTNDPQYHINFNPEDITFGEWSNFYYEQLDTSNMSNMLNTLSQCTLTNIYVDANNNFRTDYLCDDSTSEVVMEIDGNTNTYEASLAPGAFIGYQDVRVTYIPRELTGVETLAQQSNVIIQPGDNALDNIGIGEHASNISNIEIDTGDIKLVYLSGLAYNKDYASLVVHSSELAQFTANIYINGVSAKTNTKVYGNSISTTSTLEMKNPILDEVDIPLFVSRLKQLLTLKEKDISLKGIYNPQLTLGNLVHVVLSGNLNTSGYYKVKGINLGLSSGGLTYSLDLASTLVTPVQGG